MQIVLARQDESAEVVKPGRPDLGIPPVLRPVKVPVSLMWLNDGGPADVEKARRFAAAEGYSVFTYEGEADPLGRARREVARG